MSFSQRYHKALAFKSMDVEEPVDMRLHRPLAAAFTAVVSLIPWLRPNHVTLMSLFVGWGGSWALYRAAFQSSGPAPHLWALASFLLFASVILDCADGQLARSTGGGSRVGRILDGVVDALVLFPAYVLMGFAIKARFDAPWFWLACVAGGSTWIHCIVYDKLKNLYLAHTQPGAGGGEGTESPEEVRQDLTEALRLRRLLDALLLSVYLGYLKVQERLAAGSTESRTRDFSPEKLEAYRLVNRPTMRLASWMGLGTHMALIYSAIALAGIWPETLLALQVVLASAFNLLMLAVLLKSRTFRSAPEAA